MEIENTNQLQTPVQSPSQNQPPPSEDQPRQSKKIIIILVIIVALFFFVVGSYLLGTNKNQSIPKDQKVTVSPTNIVQPSPTNTPIPIEDSTANWKIYTDSWITFKYPTNLYAKSGAQFGDEHVVSLVSNPDGDYRSAEFIIDSSLRGNLADYDTALKAYEANVTNPQINNANGGVVISGTISNQMVSNLNIRYFFLKYKSGAVLIKDEKFTSVVNDKTFDQILSTFKFTK